MSDEEDWFGFLFADETPQQQVPLVQENVYEISFRGTQDLAAIMSRIGTPENIFDPCQDYFERKKLIETHMGSMALCRGPQGGKLREAGAIYAILSTLSELLKIIPHPRDAYSTKVAELGLQLAIACFGAARDLACGSAENRKALRETRVRDVGGIEILVCYVERCDNLYWDEMDTLQLKLLTSVIGTMRNATHGTGENSIALHKSRVSEKLLWRLKFANRLSTCLPDPKMPWREGAFRTAATLINISQKCPECACLCGQDPVALRLLVESWGGSHQHMPLLHLGLAAILRSAKEYLPPELYHEEWDVILIKENERKLSAQTREDERKRRI